VWDLRPASRRPLTVLSGADRILYLACDAASDLRRLAACLDESPAGSLPLDAIEQRLGLWWNAGCS
jgi:hypothetical protein